MHPATKNKTLIRLGSVVSLLPLFVAPMVLWAIWYLNNSPIQLDLWSQVKRAASTLDPVLMVVLGTGGVLAAALLMKRGIGATGSLAIVVGLTTVGGWIASSYISNPPGFEMDLPEGTTAWCNGVKLGHGRFRMTYQDFDNKVKPVDTPPDQPHVVTHDQPQFPDHKWYNADWTFIPGDPTPNHFGRWWPPFPKYAELMNVMRNERYWWRFEQNGYSVTRGAYVNSTRIGGQDSSVSVYLQYAAKERHIQVLRELLEADGYEPDAAFHEHVALHGLERDLDAAVHGPFDADFYEISIENEAAADKLLDSVIDRVLEAGTIQSPSRETGDLSQIARQYPEVIKRRLRSAVQTRRSYQFGSHQYKLSTQTRSEVEGLLIGAIAVEENIIDERLFDECVLYQKWNMLVLYNRPEVAPLLRTFLKRQQERYRVHGGITFLEGYLRLAMKSNLPEVQEIVREYLAQADESDWWLVQSFVKRQIELDADPTTLTDWVETNPAIRRDRLMPLLVKLAPTDFGKRIDRLDLELSSPDAHWIRNAAPPVVDWMIQSASTLSNAQIEWPMTALAMNADNKRVRRFLTDRLAESADTASQVSTGLQRAGTFKQQWVTAAIAELIDDSELEDKHKSVLLSIVGRLDTEAAKAVTKGLTSGSGTNSRITFVAKQRAKRKQAQLRDVELAKSLITGEIKPIDLLESNRYVWGEHGYEIAE